MPAFDDKLMSRLLRLASLTRLHRALEPWMAGLGTILMFHRVLPQTDALFQARENVGLQITPAFLESLLHYFGRRNYEVIGLDELHRRLVAAQPFRRRFVCFTFDDGYVDNYEIAYPVFRRHAAPFTVYVTTSFLDKTAVLWWYMLEDLVREQDRLDFDLGNEHYKFPTATQQEKQAAYTAIRRILLRSELHLRQAMETLFQPYGIAAENYAALTLDWSQVREMNRDDIVTIGAHTVNHYNLKQLTDDDARHEILASKKTLEEKLDTPVEHFAYPFGSRAEAGVREFALARQCGFKTATTTRDGNIFETHREHLECLPRIPVTGRFASVATVEMRLCGLSSLARNGPKRVVTV